MKMYGRKYLDENDLKELGIGSVGHNVRVHETCELIDIENFGIGDNVRIDAYTVISAYGGYVKFGSYIHIASGCFLGGGSGIEFSDFSALSHGGRVYSVSDDYCGSSLTNPTVPKEFLNTEKGPVYIGRHVIVGACSVVLPSVSIGDGSSVGALTLINKSLPEWGIYVGQPARLVRERSRALLEMEKALMASSCPFK